ncbi:hypothetical protein ACOUJC_18755 [Acinetobacter baumannii]|uniref:hypothetical protein n=3 Tax=Acinetobacter baumannii TaxID=470 RepID=UPI001FAD9343|nr:hypothetical protein [Acinetobacter baumannii]MCJ0737355.1 hypothetical protein [Acinetobacter baumannii]MCJ0773492.1 hypothetical protein [Acinetobacter baumannii]MCJ0777387.1 hypothetical protein [Acinetobacter baumannii]MCJ0795896.1 hypothetical protein [Acinetobacter baumannii]MCK0808135.1 hypothetical protein [Acinetobacter baumannii]
MDKYKVIAEKITYSLDGYIADHNNRNFGDADGWLRHVRNGWEEFIEAHPDSLNLHEYLQHHQAKVDELKATIKGNHGRIAELERLNRVKAQAIIDLHQEITELKASHHGEVIGHEVHFKKIKQERDELQALYTQQGINMLKLQKRVDQQGLIIANVMSIASDLQKSWSMFEIGKKLEQALKGDQYDEHRKKAEEAISKGASLTNHRIEL